MIGLKRLGYLVAAVVLLLVLARATVYLVTSLRMGARHEVAAR